MLLDKVGKEKNDLKDSNFQLKFCINDLKASMCALKATLISCSYRAEIAKNQTQNSMDKSNRKARLAIQPYATLKR